MRERLEALERKWRVTCHQAGQGSAGNKARRQCADELRTLLDGCAGEVEAVAWKRGKPSTTGVYRVRGWEIGARCKEAVVVVAEHDGLLHCNLHESTSETDIDEWGRVDDFSDAFEWQRVDYTHPSAVVVDDKYKELALDLREQSAWWEKQAKEAKTPEGRAVLDGVARKLTYLVERRDASGNIKPTMKTAARVFDKGPWKTCIRMGRDVVFSDDFEHDVTLTIGGDFGSTEEREAYARWLAETLNSASRPTPPDSGAAP